MALQLPHFVKQKMNDICNHQNSFMGSKYTVSAVLLGLFPSVKVYCDLLYCHVNMCEFLWFCGSRVEKAKKFVKAISRPTRSDLAPIRVKEPVRFEQLDTIFPRFVLIVMLCIKLKEAKFLNWLKDIHWTETHLRATRCHLSCGIAHCTVTYHLTLGIHPALAPARQSYLDPKAAVVSRHGTC